MNPVEVTMQARLKLVALAAALALPAASIQAQQQQQQQQQKQQQNGQRAVQDLRSWDASQLYRDGWSADQMIGTQVLGPGGEEIGEVKDIFVGAGDRISRVVVEVGGWLELGDQHIGVPWKDIEIGSSMEWIRIPSLREIEDGTYSLHGRVPQGEDVAAGAGAWRVNELIGDHASAGNVARYGIVSDVVFDRHGRAKGVVINRAGGAWGAPGWYAYPWYGYTASGTYRLPFGRDEVGSYGRFDYVQFARQSDIAAERTQQPARQSQRQRGAATGGGAASGQSFAAGPVPSFEKLDGNDDGHVSLAEAGADTRISRNFETADGDRDYRLSRDEYEKAARMAP